MSCKCKNIIENFQGGSIPLDTTFLGNIHVCGSILGCSPVTIGNDSGCTSGNTTLVVSGSSVFGCDVDILGNIYSGGTNLIDIFSNGSNNNIYNTDGQLLNDRTIDVSDYSLTVSGQSDNVLTVVGSGNTSSNPLFSVQGSNGELFSVMDNLTGSLFKVSDISGLPILEVFDNNTVHIGSPQAPSLNTTVKISPNIGLNTIYSFPISAYTGAFIDYTVKKVNSFRVSNITSVFGNVGGAGDNEVSFLEYPPVSIGTTSGITFSMSANTNDVLLQVSATTLGWEVKTIIRSI